MVSPEQLHRDSLVIDSHNDAIVAHIRRGNQSLVDPKRNGQHHEGTVSYLRGLLSNASRNREVQLNVPKLRAGGVNAAFFAVDVTRALHNHLSYAMDAIGFLAQEEDAFPEDIRIVRCANDILEAQSSDQIAAILVIENSEGVDRSINVLRSLYEAGVRSIGVTHNLNTWASTGNSEEDRPGGLTNFGVELVKGMNELGMLIDVSHISERGFYDVVEHSSAPIIASHSCCRALCEHPRNLRDDQIRAIADNGGSIGVTFVQDFVDASAPTFEKLINHIDHIVQLVGPDHVGIGSDFDGGGDLIEDATCFPTITAELAKRNYSAEDIQKILGQNHFRVFRAACG